MEEVGIFLGLYTVTWLGVHFYERKFGKIWRR
jgi:hypothetical protein